MLENFQYPVNKEKIPPWKEDKKEHKKPPWEQIIKPVTPPPDHDSDEQKSDAPPPPGEARWGRRRRGMVQENEKGIEVLKQFEERIERRKLLFRWGKRLRGRNEYEINKDEKQHQICPSNYSAIEINGLFGLVDDGLCEYGRMLIAHIPPKIQKNFEGYFMDIKDGDRIRIKGLKSTGVVTVLTTGRHRYYSPGQKITTCTICVPEEQWLQCVG